MEVVGQAALATNGRSRTVAQDGASSHASELVGREPLQAPFATGAPLGPMALMRSDIRTM